MPGAVYFDVDTQYDLMMPDGGLYVPKAVEILVRLKELMAHARKAGIPILGSVEEHTKDDAELSTRPDFKRTFPAHCMRTTPGQRKITETLPADPLWVDEKPLAREDLVRLVTHHRGEVYFRKSQFDVFTNPNVLPALDLFRPVEIVVFGVMLDLAVACAIEGFLKHGKSRIVLAEDAVRAVDEARGKQLLADWKARGVSIVKSSVLVGAAESGAS
ncbi:MAG: cysteine hydrolase family protein [Planctomycetota bacterium]